MKIITKIYLPISYDRFVQAILIISFIMSLVACNNNKSNEGYFKGVKLSEVTQDVKELDTFSDISQTLYLSDLKGNELNFTDILENVQLIPLETHENFIIGEIDKIQVYNGEYYILDRGMTKSLFVFDKNGKFKYSVKAKGKGPLEFMHPYDFTINFDTHELVVFDGKLSKLIFFNLRNGEPIKEKSVYFRFANIAYSGKGNYWMSSHNNHNSHLSSIDNYQLYLTDSTFNLKYKFLSKKQNSNNDYFLRNDLTQSLGASYAPRFNNAVFNIKDSILSQIYSLHFDEIELGRENYDLEVSNFFETAKTESKYYFMGKYLGGSELDYFELESPAKKISVFLDRASGIMRGGETLSFDPLKLPFYSDPVTSDGNHFISYLEPYALSNIKESVKEEELIKLPQKFFSLIQKVSVNDNPIIIRYKINLNLSKQK